MNSAILSTSRQILNHLNTFTAIPTGSQVFVIRTSGQWVCPPEMVGAEMEIWACGAGTGGDPTPSGRAGDASVIRHFRTTASATAQITIGAGSSNSHTAGGNTVVTVGGVNHVAQGANVSDINTLGSRGGTQSGERGYSGSGNGRISHINVVLNYWEDRLERQVAREGDNRYHPAGAMPTNSFNAGCSGGGGFGGRGGAAAPQGQNAADAPANSGAGGGTGGVGATRGGMGGNGLAILILHNRRVV